MNWKQWKSCKTILLGKHKDGIKLLLKIISVLLHFLKSKWKGCSEWRCLLNYTLIKKNTIRYHLHLFYYLYLNIFAALFLMEITYFDFWGVLQHDSKMKEKTLWIETIFKYSCNFFPKSCLWKCCKLFLNWRVFSVCQQVKDKKKKKKKKQATSSAVQVLHFLYETNKVFFLFDLKGILEIRIFFL